MHYWQKHADQGKVGETAVLEYLESTGKFERVRDVSMVPLHQRRGVDIIAELNGKEIWFDVKTDTYIEGTGNVVWELLEKAEESKLGWALTSKSHWLAIFVPQTQEILFARMKDVQRCVIQHWKQLKPYKSPHTAYNTLGMLLPVRILRPYCRSLNQMYIPELLKTLCHI